MAEKPKGKRKNTFVKLYGVWAVKVKVFKDLHLVKVAEVSFLGLIKKKV